jgi:aspartyl-tRNA(Asn)/glutamyl-tRNA(Gln) amidotransferase subunit A
MDDLLARSAIALAAEVRAGRVSAREVVDAYLARLALTEPAIHAYLAVDADGARAAAAAVDAAIARGDEPGPLAGVPLAVKDLIVTRGLATTAASRILDGWIPPYDATAVARLRAAGAIVVGKTNCDEFGMARRRRWRRARPRSPSAPTPAARSGSRPRCAAWSA